MNSMKVKVLSLARRDLKYGFDFYERQESGVGSYFVNTLYSETSALCITAGIHSKRGKLFRMKSRKFPYWIYYVIRDEIVYVLTILDARRSPSTIRRREKQVQLSVYDSETFNP